MPTNASDLLKAEDSQSSLLSEEFDSSEMEDLSLDDRKLLEQLSAAEGVAKGVENELDDLLGRLDYMLASMGTEEDMAAALKKTEEELKATTPELATSEEKKERASEVETMEQPNK